MREQDYMYDESAPDEDKFFSNKTKNCCARVVGVVATISFVCGLGMLLYGALSFGVEVQQSSKYMHKFDIDENEAFGYMAVICGSLALFVGILGCASAYYKNCCVSGTFCCLSLLVGLFALLLSAFVIGFDWDNVKTQACDTIWSDFQDNTGTEYFRQQYGSMVDDKMCSSVCPCASFSNGDVSNEAYMNMLQLEKYGADGRSPSTDVTDSDALVFAAPGDPNAVSNYLECYETIKDNAPAEGSEDEENWIEFVQNGGFDFLAAIEEEFDCAGMCYAPLFYLTKDLTPENVPVRQGCVEAFVERAKGTEFAGAIGIAVGVLLWVAGIGAVPLCSDYAK